MQRTRRTFNERVTEINEYYEALNNLYADRIDNPDLKLFHDEQFLKMLKSNALLMLYNLVESTVTGCIKEIYDTLHDQEITYQRVNEKIQKIWFDYKFNDVLNRTANHDSHKDKALEIINLILQREKLCLYDEDAKISRNLDAKEIRAICKKHGIEFTSAPESYGGRVLEDVKNKRNHLAHGVISFADCGRDYSMDKLEGIKDQAILYLEGLLDGMECYHNAQAFLCPATA